jgi:transposase
MLFIGLDISLRATAICVLTQAGEIVWQGKALSDPEDIVKTLDRWKGEIGLAGLEACPLSEWIFSGLVAGGIEARCIETRHAQRFLSTRPVKTDKNDARGIADMMRLGHFRPVHVKSRGAQQVRTLIVARRQLVGTILQLEGTVRGLLKVYGIKIGRLGRAQFDQRAREVVCRVEALAAALLPLLDARLELHAQRMKLDRLVYKMARQDELTKRFMAIPGVGPVTSLAFKATIDDPARFKRAKSVGPHLGLTPTVYQSGEYNHSGHITKCGDRILRHLLYEAAAVILGRSKAWSTLRAWGVQVAKRQGLKRARVAVARKLAVIMHRMWMTGSDFRFSDQPVPSRA